MGGVIFQDNIHPELTIRVNILRKNVYSTSLKKLFYPNILLWIFEQKVTKGDKNMAGPINHSLVNRSNLIFHHPHLNSGVYIFRIDFWWFGVKHIYFLGEYKRFSKMGRGGSKIFFFEKIYTLCLIFPDV